MRSARQVPCTVNYSFLLFVSKPLTQYIAEFQGSLHVTFCGLIGILELETLS